MSCSLLKDENSSSLSCATVFKSVKNCHFSRVSCSVRKFLQDSHFISILSKRSSQTSVDSVMYMGDRDIRQRAIKEDNGVFPIICLHIAIKKVKTSPLNFFSCTLVILPLLFTCCMPYFSEKSMPILLLETLLSYFDTSVSNNFNIVFTSSKISTIPASHRIVLARVSMGNEAMGLPV